MGSWYAKSTKDGKPWDKKFIDTVWEPNDPLYIRLKSEYDNRLTDTQVCMCVCVSVGGIHMCAQHGRALLLGGSRACVVGSKPMPWHSSPRAPLQKRLQSFRAAVYIPPRYIHIYIYIYMYIHTPPDIC